MYNLLQRGRYGVKLWGILVQDGAHGFSGSWLLKGALSRKYLVHNCAQRKNVGTVIDWLSTHLFRRHVAHGAHHHAGLSSLRCRGDAAVQRPVVLRELR